MNSLLISRFLVPVFLSFFSGAVLGLERKFRQQIVGMRTLILISESCTLLSMLSTEMTRLPGLAGGDPTRITAGVVSGIGFLGGGAILRQGLNIKGLTSAAIIWTAAAVGLSVGAGFYLPAVIILLVCVCSLVFLERVEEKYFPAVRIKSLHLRYCGNQVDIEKITRIISESGLIVIDMNMTEIIVQNELHLQYAVKAPSQLDQPGLCKNLGLAGNLLLFSLTD
jgi:putative Mg2+ transporter-C (MgtC) family protein